MVYVTARVNEKGQVVIPKILRDAYGILPDSEIMIGERDNALVIEHKMNNKEFAAALDSFPKYGKLKVDSDKNYEEELDSR